MRYKEFNRNRVLEKCIPIFWQNGFHACSIKQIVEATGVNRFSLYQEFDNKEGILYSALDLYLERYSTKKLELLTQPAPLKEVLTTYYMSHLIPDQGHPPGCFILHIATELADSDAHVNGVLANYVATLEQQFALLVERQDNFKGDSSYLARHLTALFCNAMCFCLIQTPQERKDHVTNGLSIILQKSMSHATHA